MSITTIQELFDKAWAWANRPDAEKCEIFHTSDWRECKYYDYATSNRCFFGAILSEPLARAAANIQLPWDEMLDSLILGEELSTQLCEEATKLRVLSAAHYDNYKFFDALQFAHDDPSADGEWQTKAIENLRMTAREFNLTVPS